MIDPIIGITMGDPAGNGPELCMKVLADQEVYKRCRPLVIGDAKLLELVKKATGHDEIKIRKIAQVSEAKFEYGTIDIIDLDIIDLDTFQFGRVNKTCGDAAFQYVKKVIDLALDGQVDATVTNALNKEAINLAGHHYDGHTEIYAHFTDTEKYTMMLAHHEMRVVHVSTHVSMREACARVKRDRVLDVIRIANDACIALGIEHPKIGVCGLNPHAGENGLFGNEEIEEIIPAIEAAKTEGIQALGPLPSDSAFSKMRGGWYDIVVCMYHDQGHIPLKVIGFVYNKEAGVWDAVEGVNVTLGLPIIRASVDHGTGFGHAGQGTASEKSLLNAVDYAIRLTQSKT